MAAAQQTHSAINLSQGTWQLREEEGGEWEVDEDVGALSGRS